MKRKLMVLALFGMLFAGTSAHAHDGVHLNLNGNDVKDPSARMAADGTVYVNVKTFADYYGAKIDWDAPSKVLKVNGTPVSSTYGEADPKQGTASIRALTSALGGNHSSIGWDAGTKTVNVTIMPEGTVQLTPDVPQMGEHWAKPGDMPIGPIYGVHNGKLVFIELMLAKDLQKTVHDIPGTTVPVPARFDHEDIDWNPEGHPGFEAPHYDVHFYYISREEQNKIMPSEMSAAEQSHH